MTYARIENNIVVEYPVFAGDIQLRYPNVSFSIPLVPPEGYVGVVGAPFPTIDYTKNVVEGTPELIQDTWTQVWVVSDATPEQIAQRTDQKGNEVRAERNGKLAKCDWTQLYDSPLNPDEKLAWGLYREALRMVPQQTGFPWTVNWPPEPGT
jgi:hypothetical protein